MFILSYFKHLHGYKNYLITYYNAVTTFILVFLLAGKENLADSKQPQQLKIIFTTNTSFIYHSTCKCMSKITIWTSFSI